MMRAFRNLLLVLVATAAIAPATASAGPLDVLRDCADNGMLDGRYSKSTLNAALQSLGGDLAEYSDCQAVISAALAASPPPGANTSDNGDGGGSANTAGDADDDGSGSGSDAGAGAKDRPDDKPGANTDDGDRKELASIDDGFGLDAGSGADDDSGGISLPALLALIAVVLAAVAGAVALAARHNPDLAERLRRVPLPGRRG